MRILGVGTATLDIVNTVEDYPVEDTEVRALEQRISLGGNAANTLVVLRQLGHECAWAGTIADDSDSHRIRSDLKRHGIAMDHAVACEGGKTPTSHISLNRRNGSRTIVHFRNLPEYSFEDFSRVDLAPYDWVHFEGRNVPCLKSMLRRVKAGEGVGCSLEIEKARDGIEGLFPLASLLLFSRGYALRQGFGNGASLLSAVRNSGGSNAVMTCSWGANGAWGLDDSGKTLHSRAFKVTQVRDTLGAGDVFNAAMIHGMLPNVGLSALLDDACRLAARKVGQVGFEGLGRE